MMNIKIQFKNGEKMEFDHVHYINYNYNGVGEIQIKHGKYHYQEDNFLITNIETFRVI